MSKITKYQLVKEAIRKEIENGHYGIGEKIPPESQMMDHFSVSRHTIRQAVSSLVHEGFLQKVQGSGTFVLKLKEVDLTNHKANKTIGVITTYLSDYIFPSIIRGIEEELRMNGYSMLLASTQNDTENERKSLKLMLEHQISGLIVEPTKSSYLNPNLSYYLQMKEAGIPFLYLHSSYPEMDASVVGMDDVGATKLAVNHLIEQGHQKITFITKEDDFQGRARLKGFISAFEESKLPLTDDSILLYHTENQWMMQERISTLLNGENRPTGIITYNDQIAQQVVEEAKKAKIIIPKELSIVSHDASGLRMSNGISLTSVLHPKEEMGRDAARLLIQAIENRNEEGISIRYEPQLIIQDSTAPPYK